MNHYAQHKYNIYLFLEEVPTQPKDLFSLQEILKKSSSLGTILVYKKGDIPESFASSKRRVTFKKLSELKKEKQATAQTLKPSRPRQRTLSIDPSLEQWKRGERTPSPDEARNWRNREFDYRAAKLSPPSSEEKKFFAD